MPIYSLTTGRCNETHANVLTCNKPLRPCTCLHSELQQAGIFPQSHAKNVPNNNFLQAHEAHEKRANRSDPLSGDDFRYVKLKQAASFDNLPIYKYYLTICPSLQTHDSRVPCNKPLPQGTSQCTAVETCNILREENIFSRHMPIQYLNKRPFPPRVCQWSTSLNASSFRYMQSNTLEQATSSRHMPM
jgi:hypothetical protein